MKINTAKTLFFAAILSPLFWACTSDDDFEIHEYRDVIFSEDFSENAVDNQNLITPNWLNIAEVGTVKWKTQIYKRNAYAEFSTFQSPDVVNIGWLISPEIDMDQHENEKLLFVSAQSFVTSSANSIQVFISKDFDGINIGTANWTALNATFPTPATPFFEFIKSGEIDLSDFSGKIRIAFKVKGGKNNTIDGTYQVDNIRIIY
ncbi:MAG: choice-of-anchor J domain-containing protein [Flavobacterium sp.]